MKKRLVLVFQTLVSVAMLAWIFRKPELRAQALQVVASADVGWLAAGFLLAGFCSIVGVVRWDVFLRMQGIRLSLWDVFRISFVGLFFNNFIVGAVGGDVVKVVWLAAKGHKKAAALFSVLMDRMSGLPPLLIASVTFILLRLSWLKQSPVVAGVIQFVFIYLGVVALLLTASFTLTSYIPPERLPKNFPGREKLQEMHEAYFLFVKSWRQTLWACFLSLLILLGHFLTFYCSARAFALQLPVLEFFALMPAVDIISAMPVSLGGFGVREQLFVTLLHDLAGTPEAQAVSISLCGALLTMVWGIFGIVLVPSYRQTVNGRQEA